MNSEILQRNNVKVTGNPAATEWLVMLHGFGTDQKVWSKMLPAFEHRYRIVLLDHLGARSAEQGVDMPKAHQHYDLHGFAADVVDILNALEISKATLVGHSAGGMIGMLAGLRQPGLFSRQVLIGSSPRYINDNGYVGGFTKQILGEIHLAILNNYQVWTMGFAADALQNKDDPADIQYFVDNLKAIPQAILLKTLISIFESDCRPQLGRVNTPTLIIQAHYDPIVPGEVAHYMRQHIAGSQLRVIETSGHLPHLTAPQVVSQAMIDFGI